MNNIQDLEIEEIKSNLGNLNENFSKETILILGCGGFLGHLFTKYFLSVGSKVIGMDNFVVGLPRLEINHPNFEFFNHDVCQQFFDKLHGKKIDRVINCCGIADPKIYSKYPIECMDISYNGTKNVLQFIREKKIKSSIFYSSSEIYGDPFEEFIPTKEDYNGNCPTIGERSMYDEGKRILETACSVYSRLYDINIKVIRPFNTYSSFMSLKDNRVLPSFMRNILESEPIRLFKPANETRTFCYATDFIEGCIRILLSEKSKFEIYNCGNDSPEISMADLADLVVKVTQSNTTIDLVDPPPVYKIQPKRRCPDITKLKNLGYKPKITLEEGIRRYFVWAKENYKPETQNAK